MLCRRIKRFAEFCTTPLPATDRPLDAWFDAYYGVGGWEWVDRGRSINVLQGNGRRWRLRRLLAWERLVYEVGVRYPTIYDTERLETLSRGICHNARTREWTISPGLARELSRWTSKPPIRLMVTRDTLRTEWCVPRLDWEMKGLGAKRGTTKRARRPVQLSLPLRFS